MVLGPVVPGSLGVHIQITDFLILALEGRPGMYVCVTSDFPDSESFVEPGLWAFWDQALVLFTEQSLGRECHFQWGSFLYLRTVATIHVSSCAPLASGGMSASVHS